MSVCAREELTSSATVKECLTVTEAGVALTIAERRIGTSCLWVDSAPIAVEMQPRVQPVIGMSQPADGMTMRSLLELLLAEEWTADEIARHCGADLVAALRVIVRAVAGGYVGTGAAGRWAITREGVAHLDTLRASDEAMRVKVAAFRRERGLA